MYFKESVNLQARKISTSSSCSASYQAQVTPMLGLPHHGLVDARTRRQLYNLISSKHRCLDTILALQTNTSLP